MSTTYKVGDTLKCRRRLQRRDGLSEIRPGDEVRVLQAYSFTMPDGQRVQDITVQWRHDLPIAIIHRDGDFELVQPKDTQP